jgi:hypothetical protein
MSQYSRTGDFQATNTGRDIANSAVAPRGIGLKSNLPIVATVDTFEAHWEK